MKSNRVINSQRGRAWLLRLVRSVRDWFTGEDARKSCEFQSLSTMQCGQVWVAKLGDVTAIGATKGEAINGVLKANV